MTQMNTQADADIPIRLDFIMSDVKKSVVGTEEVVVTTAEDVRNILTAVQESGISTPGYTDGSGAERRSVFRETENIPKARGQKRILKG